MLGDIVGDVVDCDDPIEQSDKDKNQEPEGEIIEKRIEIQIANQEQQQADEKDGAHRNRRDKPFAQPKPALAQSADIVTKAPGGRLHFGSL